MAFYNEIDPFAAATMRELIKAGEIAPGIVDERDIRDVTPIELAGFTQCHFFAGGGVWSYGLRRAGWRDEWPIWTGSCPCQPFSAAGKGLGFDDERHLWPAWQWLIEQCAPEFVAGEQVADKGADAWLDLVQADLEGMDYAFGCVPLASAGFGAPNPRHRTFWLAYAESVGHERAGAAWRWWNGLADDGDVIRLANPASSGRAGLGGRGQARASERRHADRLGNSLRDGAGSVGGNGDSPQATADGNDWRLSRTSAPVGDTSSTRGMADAMREGLAIGSRQAIGRGLVRGQGKAIAASGVSSGLAERSTGDGVRDPGPVNGFWADADWLYCRDPRGARWRPVDRSTFPLAPGTPERVGTVRLSGNAINAEVATGFIEAVMETLDASVAGAREGQDPQGLEAKPARTVRKAQTPNLPPNPPHPQTKERDCDR